MLLITFSKDRTCFYFILYGIFNYYFITGGKSNKPFGGRLSISSMKGKPGMGSETSLTGSGAIRVNYRTSQEPAEMDTAHSLQKASLYVFGDKAQVKGFKVDHNLKVDFVPVDYPEPRRIRASFKSLMRATAPSSVAQGNNAQEKTFFKLVEQSEWLPLLQTVMQVSIVDYLHSRFACKISSVVS